MSEIDYETPGGAGIQLDEKDVKPFKLTDEQIQTFKDDGFVCIEPEEIWSEAELEALLDSALGMGKWPEVSGKYWMYFEEALQDAGENKKGDRILQRLEKFIEFNPTLNSMLNSGKFLQAASDLLEEDAILYKEKLNYKKPGAQGFNPHQDYAAGWWLYDQTNHVSALISLDASNIENGCLELVRGRHKEGLLTDQWKEIPDDLAAEMKWEPYPTKPGSVVFFDAFVPHKSAPNPTDSARRILYFTYAKSSEGDHRLTYYSDKHKNLPPDIDRDPNKDYKYRV